MKRKIKSGIYSISILMMGVIGITGSLSAVAENFPEMKQYMIQNPLSCDNSYDTGYRQGYDKSIT